MKYLIMVFILVIAIIIIAGHAALYFSWLKFYHIEDIGTKKNLGIAMAVLSLTFVVTTLLVHWHENFFFNSMYYLAGAWLGTLWYLFLAILVTWFVFFIARFVGGSLNISLISNVLIGLAVAVSIYGLVNAQEARVKHVTVHIKNLPASWQGRTVVQLSDIHLGPIHRDGFMRRVINKVQRLKPDAVFITGDLFDGSGTDLHKIADPLNQLNAPLGTYIITGNHEYFLGIDTALEALRQLKLTVLRDQLVTIDGVQLLGVDYASLGLRKDISRPLQQLDPTKPNIVLFHEPTHLDAFKAAGVNLLLTGHTHRGQVWPFNYITQAVYHGNDYGLHSKGDFNLYTSTGVGTWGPAMRIGNRPEIVVIHFQ